MTARGSIAMLAAEQFRQRQAKAQGIVRNGGMLAGQAERHLRPWLAIACICGADLPELQGLIEARRIGHEAIIGPGHARWLVAEDICPRREWAPLLGGARDLAFDRFVADQNPDRQRVAADLQRLCLALQRDANGHHIPHYRPAIEREPMKVAA
jgi:hypothetical protein